MSGATPYVISMVIVLLYAGMYVISKAALVQGINSFVFTFYRQAAASLLFLPIVLVFQRKKLLCLSPRVLLKLFFCALIGNTACLNLILLSMAFTSATVASAAANSTPVFTFFLALLCRMEMLKLRSSAGIAKLAGVGLCITGVFVIAFYAGPALNPVNHHHAFTHTVAPASSSSQVTWIIGTFLMVLAAILWSIWMVMQTSVLKEYPNKMLVTVAQCMFSVVQCFVVAVVAERDFSKWRLRFDVSLLAVLYCGFVVTGLCYYLQVWCIEKKGPVFVVMFTPLLFIFTIFSAAFFLGEIVHFGSIIGGVLLVCGLYSVLWGKSREPTVTLHHDANMTDGVQEEKDHQNMALEEEKATSGLAVEQV